MFFQTLLTFWIEYPALFYGLMALLGFYSSFGHWDYGILCFLILLIPFILNHLILSKKDYKRLIASLLLFSCCWLYGSCHYCFPSLPTEGLFGTASIRICSLSSHTTRFGSYWIYQCELTSFVPQNSSLPIAKHIKCIIRLPKTDQIIRPPADKDYLVQGILQETNPGKYRLKINKNHAWQTIKGTWSLAERRFQAKAIIKQLIANRIPDKTSSAFLAGLFSGDFDDPLMQAQFSRFGLQHVMAVSGFHFAIITVFLQLLLRCLLPFKPSVFTLIGFLSMYFIFAGCQPSILRAWTMCVIPLIGQLAERPSKALNALGMSLLLLLSIDPLLCQTLGFQFSFLITASILLFYSSIDSYLSLVLVKRPLSEVIEMDKWNKHAYYVLALFRQSLSLTLSVNAVALPLTLYYFHQFPYASLLYNLFFPFLVSLSMWLLMGGFLASALLLPFDTILYRVNQIYTKWMLSLTYQMPQSFDYYFKIVSFPSWALILYLCFILSLGAYLKTKTKEETIFPFI